MSDETFFENYLSLHLHTSANNMLYFIYKSNYYVKFQKFIDISPMTKY
jgi:hypothetical protein